MITARSWVAAVAMIAFVQVGCSPTSRYPLRLYDLDQRQLLERATVVVVGKTVAAQWQRATVSINWSKQAGVSSARLVKAKLSIEQVVRGSVEGDEVTAYYWAADVFTNARSLHLPSSGERAVHYLANDGGILRYVTDLGRSTTPVFSGAHRDLTIAADVSEKGRLAAILLTPGEDMNVADFTKNLSTSTADSLQLVGFVETLPLLEGLAESSVWDVRWAACLQLYRSGFMGHDACIDKLAPEAVRHGREAELLTIQSQRRDAEPWLRHAFLSNPIRTAKDYALLPGNSGVADFLKMLAQHPDKQIAARAEEELRTCCRSGPE